MVVFSVVRGHLDARCLFLIIFNDREYFEVLRRAVDRRSVIS